MTGKYTDDEVRRNKCRGKPRLNDQLRSDRTQALNHSYN